MQPYPDVLLDALDPDADPAAVLVRREHIELAFVAAIQCHARHEPLAVKLFTVDGQCITGVTGFAAPHLFEAFGLPPAYPG